MEQIQYKSYERGEEFNPRKTPTLLPQIERQARAFQAAEDANFQAVQRNNAIEQKNAERQGKDLESLAKFSQKLSDTLITVQEERNEAEMQAGMMDVYENGMDMSGHDAGVDQLRQGHLGTEAVASDLESNGATVFAGQQVRQASGWRAYGQVVAMAQVGAANYPAFVEMARANASVTITDENGEQRTVTYETATTPAEFQALQASIRSQFLSQFRGINPAVLNEHLFPGMRQADARMGRDWARGRGEQIKDERQAQAYADFNNGIVSINDTYQILTNSGVNSGKARAELIQRTAEMYINGDITAAQYEEIKRTPFGPGGTWGGTNSREFEQAEVAARSNNVQEQNLEDRERQQAYDAEAESILDSLREGNYTQEQVEGLIEQLGVKYGDVREYKPLQEFYENGTIEGRTREDQLERLDGLYQAGELTVAEMQSGRYQDLAPNDYQRYMQLAQQSEQLGRNSNERVAAAKPSQQSIKNTIKGSIGQRLSGESVDASVPLAEAYALSELDRRATQLRVAGGMEWSQAYQQAAMELTQEIEQGRTTKGSPWYVSGTDKGKERFDQFRTPGTSGEDARQTINEWKTTTQEQGSQVFSDQRIFTEADARALSNPNNRNGSASDLKLRTILRELNSIEGGERLTIGEARERVLQSYGMRSERPFAPDAYEVDALDQDMLNELYSPYASGPNTVAVQTNNPPPVIRKGVEGGRDVIQASVAFGAPPHLAPLAAAVYANETGWGKHTVGRNNLFNIKATDGSGTQAVVGEGDINGSGKTWTETSNFRDYETGTESVRDFWQFLQSNPRYANVLTAATPMEALQELRAAGYATSPSYVRDVAATWQTMGIDANIPYQPKQLTSSPWGNTSTMSPQAAVYITGNIGPTSTGQHLDVKRIDGSFFEYDELNDYVEVEDKELGRVPLGRVPETGDWNSHTNRGSHGRDYGTYSGSKIFLRNGAKVVSNTGSEHGDYLVIELPNGKRYSFLHGTAA